MGWKKSKIVTTKNPVFMSKQELTERANELEALANEFIGRGDFDTAFIFQCQLREIIVQLYPNRK